MSPTTTTRLARPAWRLGFLAALIAAVLAVSVMPAMATPEQGCKGNENDIGNDPCDRDGADDDGANDDNGGGNDDDNGNDDCKGNPNGIGNDPCDRGNGGGDDDDEDCKGNPNGHGNDPCDRDDDDDDEDCKGNPNGHGNDPCENPETPEEPPITPPAPLPSACPAASVPASAFTDIDGNVHEFSIDCITWWEIALGVTPTTYAPGRRVTRAQTATFLANLIDETGGTLPAASDQGFNDIGGSAHAGNINRLAAAGIVVGVTAKRFEPGARVSRAQMATMIVGAYNLVANPNLPRGRDAFDDDDNSVHEGNINKAAAAGLALGKAPRIFEPGGKTRRDQMASFLARVLDNLVEQGHGTPPAA